MQPSAHSAEKSPEFGITRPAEVVFASRRAARTRPTGAARAAFTLIEVLIVVVIVAIMASLVVPRVISAFTESAQESAEARASQILTMIVRYNQFYPAQAIPVTDGPVSAADLAKLVAAGYCSADDLVNPANAANGWSFVGPKLIPTP